MNRDFLDLTADVTSLQNFERMIHLEQSLINQITLYQQRCAKLESINKSYRKYLNEIIKCIYKCCQEKKGGSKMVKTMYDCLILLNKDITK